LLKNGIIANNGTHGGSIPVNDINSAADDILTDFLTNDQSYNSSRPKAFLNWIIVDEEFKKVNSSFHKGAVQVPLIDYTTMSSQTLVGPTNMTVRRNGWLYVYVSNESNQDVYFDDLIINHKRGPVVEANNYYAFGLEIPGLASKAIGFGGNSDNRYKYNGKELQSKEFSDGSGIDWEDYGARMYDPKIGRWMVVDPKMEKMRRWSGYCYGADNPIKYIDLEGLTIGNPNDPATKRAQEVLNKTQAGQELWVRMEASSRQIFFQNLDTRHKKSMSEEDKNLLAVIRGGRANAQTFSETQYNNAKKLQGTDDNITGIFNKKTGKTDKTSDWNKTYVVFIDGGLNADPNSQVNRYAQKLGLELDRDESNTATALKIIGHESEHTLQDEFDYYETSYDPASGLYTEDKSKIIPHDNRVAEQSADAKAWQIIDQLFGNYFKKHKELLEPKKQ